MYKNAPKILAVVLLIVIAVLMLVAGSDSIKTLFTKDTPHADANNNPNNDNNDQTPNDTLPNDDDDEDDDEDIIVPTAFPKAALESEMYLFEQELFLKGGLSLNAVHLTTVGIYIVVTSTAEGGDFSLTQKSVSVIKMTSDGTLEKALHLSLESETAYLGSQITASGLAVAVQGKEKTHLYTVGYELDVSPYIELPHATAAHIFPLREGFMLLAEGRENTMYLIKNGIAAKETSVQSGKVAEVFETAAGYMIFINGLNGYSVLNLDKNLNGYTSVSIPEKTVLKVMPLVENATQKYIVAEKEGGAVYITKYASSFRTTDDRICLGIAESADIYINGETIFAVLKNQTGRIYLVDLALNTTLSNAGYFQGVTDIYDCHSYPNGYLMLAETETALSFIDLRNDGSVSVHTIAGNRGIFIRTPLERVMLFYMQGTDKVRIICTEL